MKARHVIMIIIILIALSFYISNKDTEYLTCTTSGTLYESPTDSKVEISLKNNKIKDFKITMDMHLNDELNSQKELLMQAIASEGKSEVTETKDGIRLTSGMDSSYFTNFGLTKDSNLSELKEVLELQGFACQKD